VIAAETTQESKGVAPGSAEARRGGRRRRRRTGGVVAITGIHGVLATGLLRRLVEDDRYERLVLLDVRAPSKPLRKAVFHKVDLTEPLADALVAEVLRCEQVETIVHLALREAPRPLAEGAHELETVGTMYLLNGVADCISRGTPLGKLVTVTTTMVYGADARNPNFLTEDHALWAHPGTGFVRDKIEVEKQLAEFRAEQGLPICVLRPCWTLGRSSGSIAARLLGQSPALSVMGFDPLLQLLHDDDLQDVVKRAVDRTYDGAFNLTGGGVLPLSALFRIAGRSVLPVPGPIVYPLAGALWRSYGIGTGVSMDFVRYLWVADSERAMHELGFAPRYSTREVVESYATH
jgi:UDP-glucose 4-epimerase